MTKESLKTVWKAAVHTLDVISTIAAKLPLQTSFISFMFIKLLHKRLKLTAENCYFWLTSARPPDTAQPGKNVTKNIQTGLCLCCFDPLVHTNQSNRVNSSRSILPFLPAVILPIRDDWYISGRKSDMCFLFCPPGGLIALSAQQSQLGMRSSAIGDVAISGWIVWKQHSSLNFTRTTRLSKSSSNQAPFSPHTLIEICCSRFITGL